MLSLNLNKKKFCCHKDIAVNPTWISLGVLAALAPSLHQRFQLSRAKHRSLAGHSRMAKRLARWLPGYSFDEAEFFACDGAPENIQATRRAAFMAMLRNRRSASRCRWRYAPGQARRRIAKRAIQATFYPS